MSRRWASLAVLAAAAVWADGACTSAVAPVDPGAFACLDDQADEDLLPCPETHWCRDGSCAPRLGCTDPDAPGTGCDPARRCEIAGEDCARCALRRNDAVAAVTCEPGVHTTTSTRPARPERCDCPEGTACVAFAAGGAAGAHPLYLVPEGGVLPVEALGLPGEVPDRRWCVRACSAERDCPAGHTCRPAAWPSAELLTQSTSARSTVGVCWPERLSARTSSTTPVDPAAEPDPLACRRHADCPASGVEPCRFRVATIEDHPRAPIGEAWGRRFALVPRCSTESTSLRNADDGCTAATECKSGLCLEGRCARPCDPSVSDGCPMNRACLDLLVERRVDGAAGVVEDRAFVCAP